MSTSLPLNLYLMPADEARVDNAQHAGERLIAFGSRVGSLLWRALSAIGESRARSALSELADRAAVTRPELAAAMRRAANGNWS